MFDISSDVYAYGTLVADFPNGVGQAFDRLSEMLGTNDKRSYYGIVTMGDKGQMQYYAAAADIYEGEADKYNCKRLTIEKGQYLAEALADRRNNIACIKDVFKELIHDKRADTTKPAVECYKNDRRCSAWCRQFVRKWKT